MSQSELARRAHIAKSTLSQLESGVGNPSLETLWALSTALGVSFSALVDPQQPRVEIIRASDGSAYAAADSDYVATLLSSCPANARRDMYRVHAEPGTVRSSKAHQSGTIEHVMITRGSARVGPEESPTVLMADDYMSYPGDAPHIFEALEAGTAAVLLSEHG